MSTPNSLNKLAVLLALMLTLNACSSQKTGYVDMFKLVSEFELQKEYTDDARRNMEREKSIIDSVVFTQKLKDSASYLGLKNQLYAAMNQKAEETNKQIESMIWKRLNPYLADYGKENGYLYIYGANGTGNVLYADKSQDITEDLIKYVNKRYHDKK